MICQVFKTLSYCKKVSKVLTTVEAKFELKRNNNVSWLKLKGGVSLTDKVGNGEQTRGIVPGLVSVSGCPPRRVYEYD